MSDKIQVMYSRFQDGFVYRLHPLSRQKVKDILPEDSIEYQQIPGQISIMYDSGTRPDEHPRHQEFDILRILTGLDLMVVMRAGAYEFINTDTLET